ncbi:uncharacterized, partial [Tachysurus ichikawai]
LATEFRDPSGQNFGPAERRDRFSRSSLVIR